MLSSCKWNVTYKNIQTPSWVFFLYYIFIPHIQWWLVLFKGSEKCYQNSKYLCFIWYSFSAVCSMNLVCNLLLFGPFVLSDPMDCSTSGFPVLHCFPEFAQTHVNWVGDTIQPSYPLWSPSPPSFNLSQPQGLSQWLSSSHQVAKVLELQPQSFQWLFRVDFLYGWLVWSPCCPRDSQESSLAPWFESINSSVLSLLFGSTLISVYDYWKNHRSEYRDLWWK